MEAAKKSAINLQYLDITGVDVEYSSNDEECTERKKLERELREHRRVRFAIIRIRKRE